jgi:hypothetical protein
MAPPRKTLSLFQRLADQAHAAIKRGNLGSFTTIAAQAKGAHAEGLKKLEINYVHRWAGGKFNPHQLRDDLRTYFGQTHQKASVTKLIQAFQRQNPLQAKMTHDQVVKATLESAWPAKQRALTRERLKKPATWPSKYRHARLAALLQQWGEWVLENYQYLMTSRTPGSIGIRFVPPKSARPGADIEAIADLRSAINNAYARLLQRCEKGPYAFYPLPGGKHLCGTTPDCMAALKRWEKLFVETKGKTALNMRRKIQQRIRIIEQRQKSSICRRRSA